jgi:plastocyanin
MKRRTYGPSSSLWVFATLSAVLLTLCAVGGWAWTRTPPPTPAQGQGQTVTVTINPTNPPTVSPDPAEISKSKGDQVDWECPQCTNGFSVHFPQGTPFASSSFSNSNPNSGRAQNSAATGTYHYTVTVGGNTADPGVKLNP